MAKIKIEKISIDQVVMALLFILYLPSFVTRIVDIPYWGVICQVLVLFADIFFLIRMRRLTAPIIYISVFFAYLFLVTLVQNTSDILSCGKRTFSAISLIIMIEYIFKSYSPKQTVSIFMLAMEIFIYVNLISMILYPAGMYRVVTNGIYEELVPIARNENRTNARVIWLLGHQTMLIRFTLPAVFMSFLYSNLVKEKKFCLRSIVLVIVCLVETVIAKSAGNYSILALFVGFCLYFHYKGKINNFFVYILIAAIYVVMINISENSWVLNFMSNLLNREVSVSTRIPIWVNTIAAWLKQPIFGYGYINESRETIRQMLSAGNPHSSYLWVLFEGGIVGFGLLIYMVSHFGTSMKKYWESPVAQIIFASFICQLICMFDDDHIFRSQFFLIIFSFIYHVQYFVEGEEAISVKEKSKPKRIRIGLLRGRKRFVR